MRRVIQYVKRRAADVRVIRTVLERAEALARQEGLERPGAEHLVLAACELPDGTAVASLGAVGTTTEALRAAVREAHADGLEAVGLRVDDEQVEGALPVTATPQGPYRSEAPLQEVFDRARQLVAEESSRLCGAWFLAAAAERRRGTLARALDRLGVDREELGRSARVAARSHDPDV